MSHTSPAALLVWSTLCCFLGAFLLFHLWRFDKFRCLRWNSGSSGAFKRVMTYTYLLTIPLLSTYSIGFCLIKYSEGYVFLPEYGIFPKPYQMWSQSAKSAIFPLQLLLSIGWSFEMVTHLEELCFWFFLVNASSSQQHWFDSLYFKSWVFGSFFAVLYMPLVTIFTRSDPLKNEAYTFLAGSLGDLSLTIWFLPVLWIFPSFLQNIRAEGVDMKTLVRLTKFSELNNIRVLFRFLFSAPLLILAIDGVRPHQHINENLFWTDLLIMLGGFGAAISSGITLVIFFPRSISGEIADRDASMRRGQALSDRRSEDSFYETVTQNMQTSLHRTNSANVDGAGYSAASSPVEKELSFTRSQPDAFIDLERRGRTPYRSLSTSKRRDELDEAAIDFTPMRPNRRKGDNEIQLGGIGSRLTESNSKYKFSNVNPLVHNFTSPINLVDDS